MRMRVLLKVFSLVVMFSFLFTGLAWAGFSDVSSNHWAAENINKMSQRGVVSGYTDGTFKPDRTVSQVEAICMAVRMLGLDASTASSLPQPAFTVPKWAEADVKLAVQRGLVKTEDQFNANAGASRAWVARLLVRLIGQEDKVGQEALMPNFTDTYQIPDWAVYYVRVAQDNDLVAGYSDNTFRPNNTVSRAEMVAFLSRADERLPESATGYFSGTVVEVGSGFITVRGDDGQNRTYSIPATLKVYDGGREIWVTDLKQSDRVKLLADGAILKYLERTEARQGAGVTGTVLKVYPERNAFVIIDIAGGTRTLSLPDNTPVAVEGSSASGLNALQPGDEVVVTLNAAGYVINIVVNSRSGSGGDQGIVYDLDLDLNPGLITMEYDNGDLVSYQLANQVLVTIDDVRFPTLQDVHNGDRVRITRENNLVVAIEVLEKDARLDITGEVVVLNSTSGIINLDVDGALKAYRLAGVVSVTVPGLGSAYLSDIKVGDTVRAQGNKGEITSLQVMDRDAGNDITATVLAVDTGHRVLTLEKMDGTIVAYEVLDKARIVINGSEESLGDLEKDMEVRVRLLDGDIVYVRVDKSSGGIITDIDRDGLLLVFQRANGERKTYLIDKKVDVESRDSRNELRDVNKGDYARLVIQDNLVTEIHLRNESICRVENVRKAYDRLEVVDEDGDSVRLYVRDGVDLVVPGIAYPDLDDVRVGDLVRVTYMGRDLDKVEVLESTLGEITALDIFQQSATVRDYNGRSTKVLFTSGSKVVSGSRTYNSFSNLALGDRVEVVTNADGTKTFSVMQKVSGKLAADVDEDDGAVYLEDGLRWKSYGLAEDVYVHGSLGASRSLGQLKAGDQVQMYILRNLVYEIQV